MLAHSLVVAPRRRTPATLIAMGAFALLAACSDDDPVGPGTPARTLDAVDLQRLFVADADAPSARLLALRNDSTVATYTLAGPASLVYTSGSGRLAVVHQRTANRVNFVDAGVWADNTTGHTAAAGQLGFSLTAELPTHENVNGSWISVFFDGTGRGVWMNEGDLIGGTPRVTYEVTTGAAHHGGSATVVLDGAPYLVTSIPNPAGGSPTGIEVRNGAGQVVATVANCPSLHGNNSTGGGAVFGCSDGMALVRGGTGGAVVAEKIVPTGDMAGLGLRNAYSAPGAAFILGQFSALPGQPTQRVLATIDPNTGALNRLPALPAGVTDHWRAIEPISGQIVLLGTNGSLYVYDGATRSLLRTVAGVVPALPATAALTHQVSVVQGLAAVASPYTGDVVLVNLNDGTVRRRIAVGGRPSRLAITGARRAGTYAPAQ